MVVADRDARRVPDAPGSAADTAALIELARVLEGRPTRKTLVLASLDGSHPRRGGRARSWLDELGPPGAGGRAWWPCPTSARPTRRGSYLQAWSNDSRRARDRAPAHGGRLDPRRSSTGRPDASGAFGQLARLSFPIGIGAQAVLLEQGYDAVRISGSGELPPEGDGPVDAIDEDRLGALGRATLRTLTAVDRARAPGARAATAT